MQNLKIIGFILVILIKRAIKKVLINTLNSQSKKNFIVSVQLILLLDLKVKNLFKKKLSTTEQTCPIGVAMIGLTKKTQIRIENSVSSKIKDTTATTKNFINFNF